MLTVTARHGHTAPHLVTFEPSWGTRTKSRTTRPSDAELNAHFFVASVESFNSLDKELSERLLCLRE